MWTRRKCTIDYFRISIPNSPSNYITFNLINFTFKAQCEVYTWCELLHDRNGPIQTWEERWRSGRNSKWALKGSRLCAIQAGHCEQWTPLIDWRRDFERRVCIVTWPKRIMLWSIRFLFNIIKVYNLICAYLNNWLLNINLPLIWS